MEKTGIIQRATEGREKTEEAQEKEQNTLNSYEDQINEYTGIDWDAVLANAKKHPGQKTSTAIGVGTDGRSVNMDLWQCTKLDDGTYLLSYTSDEKNIVDGKIIGTMPQYIKDNADDNFIEVTSLENCFINNKKLKYSPKIPSTIIYLNGTFANCEALEEPPVVPLGVVEMRSTFSGCVSLQDMPKIPNSVQGLNSTFVNCGLMKEMKELPDSIISMGFTFNNCTNLKNISNISKNVEYMMATFSGCSSLTNINLTIPNTVTNLQYTFQDCTNLSGYIKIDASVNGSIINNLTDYELCFRNTSTKGSGLVISKNSTCSILEDILNTKSTNSNITLEE